jgi:hypothetical protein
VTFPSAAFASASGGLTTSQHKMLQSTVWWHPRSSTQQALQLVCHHSKVLLLNNICNTNFHKTQQMFLSHRSPIFQYINYSREHSAKCHNTKHSANWLCIYKRFWNWCPWIIVSKNWIKQLHSLPALHFNCCLTPKYGKTTAHFNSNFDTGNQIYGPYCTIA